MADTERPAAQYRGRYAQRFEEARELIEKGKAAAGATEPPAPAAAVSEPPAAGTTPDAGQFGMAGTGGEVSPQAQAVLDSAKITLDENGKKDFAGGRIDPRIAAALLKLSERHSLTISATSSDHAQFTASGASESNHWSGRGIDIASIDGEVVRPNSPAARALAEAIAELDPSIRPGEVGTPFQIAAPGFFTDAAHQDHIHIAFDDPVPADWQPPETPPPPPPAPPAPPATVPPADAPPQASDAAAPPAEPEDAPQDADSEGSDSQSFMAVTPEMAAQARAAAAGGPDAPDGPDSPAGSDSGSFMAVEPPESAGGAEQAGTPASASGAAGFDLTDIPEDYPGDTASKQELAQWMGSQAEKRGLPAELPVMAGLVESGLRNLHYGDADSVGFFQMRVAIWNKGEYAGYPEDPALQLKWFLDNAEQVKKTRVASGLGADDPSSFGEWIADVERPAEQFRDRYQLRLSEARNLLRG